MTILLLIAGFLMALVAGVFLSFSDFTMRGLAQAGQGGADGMIGLNRTVYRSGFMVLLMGFVPGVIVLAALSVWSLPPLPGAWAIAGAILYLGGVMAVTGFGNVPMNQKLDAMDGDEAALRAYWPGYAIRWTRLNHIRSAASALSAAAFLTAGSLAGSLV